MRESKKVNANLVALITSVFFLANTLSCAPPANVRENTDPLELTDEMVNERINGAFVDNVPDESGISPSISWRFFASEPKEIVIVEKKVEGSAAEVILDVKTQSSPKSREQRTLSGRIRTFWTIERGVALRKWRIVQTENISLRYKDLPKPADPT